MVEDSAAGRLTSQSVANDTQTWSYNVAGELATYTLGSGRINYGYDAEGSPTSINYSTLNIGASLNPGVGGAGSIPVSLANMYSVRGGLLQSVYPPSSYFPTYSRSLPSGGYMTHETVDVNH